MFTIQYTNDNGGRAVAMAMLPPPLKEKYCSKKKSMLNHVRLVSYGKIGLTTVAVTHDLLSGMPLVLLRKELIRVWNSMLAETWQPSSQLSKLIRLTACKKTKHTVRRWYRTVYIP